MYTFVIRMYDEKSSIFLKYFARSYDDDEISFAIVILFLN